ncbi:stearoyl-CoA desaturase 5 [Lontra canadensis]|uniref:stearoyl-CoA desaturase 5 n=1 Tax=Lontra canadensis TaxID=76717 RepID=UPI0013F2E306|nr:stearoyl-CoA desaturase 5 [Lontra canadensis]
MAAHIFIRVLSLALTPVGPSWIVKEGLFLRKRTFSWTEVVLGVKPRPPSPPTWEAPRLALSLHARAQAEGGFPKKSRYYKITVVLMCFAVPTTVPWCFWGESLWNSYFLASILCYTISLNATWLVNSVAHMYGNRPYDKHISPWQNLLITLGTIGEGFHNYHHTFPFDYSASEFSLNFNPTTWFIDLMCWLELATDRKRATKPMIEARKARTGDGSL